MGAGISSSRDMLHLPEVTLCAASSLALSQTLSALRSSMKNIAFGAAKLFTHEMPDDETAGVEIVKIPPIRSRDDYSRFMLKELVRHVHTDFALVVQWDGYVIRPSAWRREFLDFDYIGAPWPQFDDDRNVGNGGFSLRSRKLLEACATSCVYAGESEDITICRTNRESLEERHGIRFADAGFASCFSYERTLPNGNEFGFHGVFNMIDILGHTAFTQFYRDLPKAVIGRREHRDLFSLALAGGYDDLSRQIIRYHLSIFPGARGMRFLTKKLVHDLRGLLPA